LKDGEGYKDYTVGHVFRKQLQPMINGFDDEDLTPEEAYLEEDEPDHIDPVKLMR